ncbi:SDR family NAD(P)-dependent oxidoreductase [Pseudoalteromonas fenneropenaei]|uniref:SDR family NAD(P)-dependent oxidoreductase n=1 Tax=Pseudoalteromonas fenneropenaei TaxID=1737459 RepID=A0ABV7CK57_9GAMM
MSLFDLTGKTIVITGGNRGIGLSLAHHLHQFGANIVILARDIQQNQLALKTLSEKGERVLSIECDVTNSASVNQAMAEAANWQGGIYGCIANAGGRSDGYEFAEMPESVWEKTLSTNLTGTFNTFQAALKYIKNNEKGRLLAISSLAAWHGNANFADYASSKAALEGLCRALAIELAPFNITVNCLVPGWIDTEMNAAVKADKRQFEAIKRLRIPLRRWAEPDELAGAAVYLMSDSSSYHTGDSLVVDGGYHIA